MTVIECLEYLMLDSILQGYMEASCLNDFSDDEKVYIPWGNTVNIDLKKLKKRIRKLQLEFLKPYIISTNSTSKE